MDDATYDWDDTDPYYDPNNTTFNHDSYPNSDNYDGEPTLVEVLNISALGGDFMTADLIVGVPGGLEVEETEPNNVWDDSGVKHIIPPNAIYDGIVDSTDDPSDFWSFFAFGAGILTADLISHNPGINMSLYLWNQDGTDIIASAETTNASEH